MSSRVIQPSTLEGIKRLAKSVKAEQNIQHIQALDIAAQFAGFQNFKHARSKLQINVSPIEHLGSLVYLTVYWRDKELGTRGRETLTCSLSTIWSNLVTPAQLKIHRALSHFKMEGPDHLMREELVQSQSHARRIACAGARTLQFMDATKLRPSKAYDRALPGVRSNEYLPGSDHESIWYDSVTKRYLLVDEPYDAAALSKAKERDAWALQHGFVIRKSKWAGMYNPDGGCRLDLITHSLKGVPLPSLLDALGRLAPPAVEENWNGESAPSLPFFVSPGTIARATSTIRVARQPGQTSGGSRNSVVYHQTFVATPQRRPKGKMPIVAHTECGRLIKSVMEISYHRKGVYNRLNSIRSELDEWVQREYTHAELPSEQFFDLYYHESEYSFSRNISREEQIRHVNSLGEVKQILESHYPDSPPLRSMLRKIDTAIQSLENWG